MEKEDYRKRRRDARRDSELSDWNEQEQEKIGFFSKIREESGTEDSSALGGLPVRSEGERRLRRQERELTRDESADEPSAFDGRDRTASADTPAASRRRRGRWGWIVLCAVMIAALALFGVAMRWGLEGMTPSSGESEELPAEDAAAVGEERIVYIRQHNGEDGLLTVPELYEACAGTVVSVVCRREGSSGVGSGMILTEDGYIGTANHVIEGMTEIEVVLADGTRHAARVISGNETTDLAVLKIEKGGLPTVTFGSSESLLFGERVVAIGTPASLDYAGSVCTGEISHPNRIVRIYEDSGILKKKMKVLQTDAPVNPGNSGCPLFNEYGQVVGVVTMKLGERYDGIGFAIPADGAQGIFEAMIAGEELTETLLWQVSVPAPRLGILGEAAMRDGLYGVLVRGFSSESAPAAFVLREGDLILQIDGTGIGSASDISEALYDKAPTDTVTVTVLRGGQRLTFEVTLGYETKN